MRNASPALKAFLAANRQFLRADLYTFTLASGDVLRYSGTQSGITVGGHLYSLSGIKFKPGTVRLAAGLEVDTFDLEMYASTEDTDSYIDGTPVDQFARQGGFDGALVRYERLIMPTWGDVSLGTVTMFYGYVSGITPGRTLTKVSVSALIGKLNIKEPRNLYQPGCVHTLFDPGCKLIRGDFTVTGVVFSGATTSTFSTDQTADDDYFALGVVIFTSGPNDGLRRTIKSYAQTDGLFTVTLPLPSAPLPGDTFSAYPGCDKTQETCTDKYNNLDNFRGYPYIPVIETAR